MTDEKQEAAELIGEVVVVDTASPFIYLGKLKHWRDHFLVLEDVDVHDTSDGRSGKDLYVMESRRNGFQPNRKQVLVLKRQVVSLSRLSDVVLF